MLRPADGEDADRPALHALRVAEQDNRVIQEGQRAFQRADLRREDASVAGLVAHGNRCAGAVKDRLREWARLG